jgi:serine/threonine protein kinase
MGVVWEAVDEVLDRPVALKEVLSPTGDQRAVREAQAAARLTSPHIVTIHDVVTDLGRPWIVMELVPGRSLASVLEDGPLPEAKVADIAEKVLKALADAHEHGVLHRDVKPANILLDDDRVVLSDFGIAAVDGHTTLTGSQDLVGSLEYLAPERMLGGDATAAADLWSLGMTLYQAVEGKSPFGRTNLPATLAATMTRAPDSPKRATALWPLLKRLLSKTPAERGTAQQTLELLQDDAPATPARPRRRKGFAILCAVTAAAACATVVIVRPEPRTVIVQVPSMPIAAEPSTPHDGEFYLQTYDTFSVVVPHGWSRSSSGQSVTMTDPVVDRHIRINPVETAVGNPFRYQQELAATVSGQTAYQQIRLTEVPPVDGHRAAADLEYSFEVKPKKTVRIFSRVEVSPWGRLYELRFVVYSSNDWLESERIRDTILESFRLR